MADKIETDVVDLWVAGRNERNVSSVTSLDVADERINVDTTGGTFSVELADTGDLQTPTGKRMVFDHTAGTDLFTIEPNSGDANSATINGASSFTTPLPGDVWLVHLYQNNWFVVPLYTTLRFFASHDRQSKDVAGPITTTSTTFVDIPGAMLTTKNLDETGTYTGWLVLNLRHTMNNRQTTFRATLNGTPTAPEFAIDSPAPNEAFQGVIITDGSGIPSGTDIQLQWKTEAGTAQIDSLSMVIDGIPDSAVKP